MSRSLTWGLCGLLLMWATAGQSASGQAVVVLQAGGAAGGGLPAG